MNNKVIAAEQPGGCDVRPTILVVEDSPVQTELLRRALEGAGYRVIAAADGAQGLAMARKERPAAIITDINMPVMDGYAMSQALREDESFNPTPIIILTMLNDPEDLIRGLNTGADGYLTKPYEASALVGQLESLLKDPPDRGPRVERRKVEVRLGDKTFMVDAHGPRILNLLMSTYQNLVLQNRVLMATQSELSDLTQSLEQKVSEKTTALANSELRFRSLIERATDLLLVMDTRGVITYVSPSANKLFGYQTAEVLGTTFLDYAHPDDRIAAMSDLKEARVFSRRVHESEFRFRCKDGSWVVLDAIARSELDNPAIGGIVVNARDITERKKADEQIKLQVVQLQAALMRTVEVATNLSGMRDRYTAGHERRVAEIAAAIGALMGFDAQRQQGLRVAGLLHDVGKIVIPAEILAKPSRLSAIEFKLIQQHAQTGYEVLKDVEFPWPVAEVALLHHERMDGSGYPQGLKGEAIPVEARIVAVADVIEAMTSHRPYRAGLGLEQALSEIERGRGTIYDATAADAGLSLFRDHGYVIPADDHAGNAFANAA